MITKVQGSSGKIRIIFSLPAAIWADTIHLVGDFNNWSTTATPMALDDTSWSVSIELDAGQAYRYRYLLNHVEWNNDWLADSFVEDDKGVDTSVVVV